MPDRTLNEIKKDLITCAEYNNVRTPQAAYRYMDDLRINMISLVELVKELRLEVDRSTEYISALEADIARLNAGSQ